MMKIVGDLIGSHRSSTAQHPVSNTYSSVRYVRASRALRSDAARCARSSLPVDILQSTTYAELLWPGRALLRQIGACDRTVSGRYVVLMIGFRLAMIPKIHAGDFSSQFRAPNASIIMAWIGEVGFVPSLGNIGIQQRLWFDMRCHFRHCNSDVGCWSYKVRWSWFQGCYPMGCVTFEHFPSHHVIFVHLTVSRTMCICVLLLKKVRRATTDGVEQGVRCEGEPHVSALSGFGTLAYWLC
jgi:hypothetical protein